MTHTTGRGLRLLLASWVLVSCTDLPFDTEAPSRTAAVLNSIESTAPTIRIRALGKIGKADARPGESVQRFDMNVGSDLTGRVDYTDYAVVRADGSVATLTVDPTDPGTGIDAFRDASGACDDPGLGVEYEGTGRLDTGEVVGFSVVACDYADPGVGLDLFSIAVPSHAYMRGDRLSGGDLTKDTLLSTGEPVCEAEDGGGASTSMDSTATTPTIAVSPGHGRASATSSATTSRPV